MLPLYPWRERKFPRCDHFRLTEIASADRDLPASAVATHDIACPPKPDCPLSSIYFPL